MTVAEIKKRVRQVRLKRLAAEIASDEPPTPLPRRFDTRPIDFSGFREWPCIRCGEPVVVERGRRKPSRICERCAVAEEERLEEAREVAREAGRQYERILSILDRPTTFAQIHEKMADVDAKTLRNRVHSLLRRGIIRRGNRGGEATYRRVR